ncbi:MAG: division/cell wall cluster transcriptional repressor MraZ [Actinomycetota bacterium]
MLLGEFRHSLDAKGRLFLPARWRDELGEGVVVSKGLDRCLDLMPGPRFAEMAEQLSELSVNRRDNRDYSRILFSGASEEAVDRQGRITLPPALREFAGLEKEVVLAGVSRRAEIWDRATWETYQQRVQPQYEEIAEKLEL